VLRTTQENDQCQWAYAAGIGCDTPATPGKPAWLVAKSSAFGRLVHYLDQLASQGDQNTWAAADMLIQPGGTFLVGMPTFDGGEARRMSDGGPGSSQLDMLAMTLRLRNLPRVDRYLLDYQEALERNDVSFNILITSPGQNTMARLGWFRPCQDAFDSLLRELAAENVPLLGNLLMALGGVWFSGKSECPLEA
jgi:hypothetical protein